VPNALVRSFVAVDLNDNRLVQNIIDTQQRLYRTGGDLKLVEPQNIHITLRFLGEIRQELIQEIIEQMKQIRFSAFKVEFKGLGVFPGLNRPRVVWIGIEEGAEKLVGIFETLEQRLRTLRIEPDRRGFTPHITIARVRSGRNRDELARLVSEMRDKEFGSISVNSVRLKRSNLTPSGPSYSDLYELQGTSV
jgi:2'-5' RNA ligase